MSEAARRWSLALLLALAVHGGLLLVAGPGRPARGGGSPGTGPRTGEEAELTLVFTGEGPGAGARATPVAGAAPARPRRGVGSAPPAPGAVLREAAGRVSFPRETGQDATAATSATASTPEIPAAAPTGAGSATTPAPAASGAGSATAAAASTSPTR